MPERVAGRELRRPRPRRTLRGSSRSIRTIPATPSAMASTRPTQLGVEPVGVDHGVCVGGGQPHLRQWSSGGCHGRGAGGLACAACGRGVDHDHVPARQSEPAVSRGAGRLRRASVHSHRLRPPPRRESRTVTLGEQHRGEAGLDALGSLRAGMPTATAAGIIAARILRAGRSAST